MPPSPRVWLGDKMPAPEIVVPRHRVVSLATIGAPVRLAQPPTL